MRLYFSIFVSIIAITITSVYHQELLHEYMRPFLRSKAINNLSKTFNFNASKSTSAMATQLHLCRTPGDSRKRCISERRIAQTERNSKRLPRPSTVRRSRRNSPTIHRNAQTAQLHSLPHARSFRRPAWAPAFPTIPIVARKLSHTF